MSVFLSLVVSVGLGGAPQQAPQPQTATAEPSRTTSDGATLEADDLPVSISRIQRALARKPTLRLKSDTPVFRIEVFGRTPAIEDILGPDYLRGPVPYGGMTHQEFLSMVTPRDVQGYAAFTNKQGFTVAATSLALQWALQRAIHKFETAKEERAREAARQEVQDALAELAKARKAAGLPPK